MTEAARARALPLILTGIATGVFSGLFGVGGGVIMVPALAMLTTMSRKRISGTSLAAIAPMAIVGVVSYGSRGNVDLAAAALLAVGAVVGAQLGTWLLERLPTPIVRWLFIAFLLLVVFELVTSIPSREQSFTLTVGAAFAFAGVGLVTGVLSGLLGIGGGVIVVSVLMLLFGFTDLVAKGTSLAMMIPTAVSGTIGNLRRGNVDMRAGMLLGITACFTTVLGTWIAQALDPQVANWLLAAFLGVILLQLVGSEVQRIRRKDIGE